MHCSISCFLLSFAVCLKIIWKCKETVHNDHQGFKQSKESVTGSIYKSFIKSFEVHRLFQTILWVSSFPRPSSYVRGGREGANGPSKTMGRIWQVLQSHFLSSYLHLNSFFFFLSWNAEEMLRKPQGPVLLVCFYKSLNGWSLKVAQNSSQDLDFDGSL